MTTTTVPCDPKADGCHALREVKADHAERITAVEHIAAAAHDAAQRAIACAEKIDARVWALLMLGLAQLVGILAVILFKK